MSKLVMPNGLSEAEQGEWYFDNQEQMIEEFLASPRAANPERSVAAKRFGLPFSIQIANEDSQLARKQADREGLDLHQYTAQVLHEALLEREFKKAS